MLLTSAPSRSLINDAWGNEPAAPRKPCSAAAAGDPAAIAPTASLRCSVPVGTADDGPASCSLSVRLAGTPPPVLRVWPGEWKAPPRESLRRSFPIVTSDLVVAGAIIDRTRRAF